MAFFNYIDTLFLLILGITFILILFLVYHYKQRIVSLEQKTETMFSLVNNIVSELSNVKGFINNMFKPPPPEPQIINLDNNDKIILNNVSDNEEDDDDEDDDDDDDDEEDDDDDDDEEDKEDINRIQIENIIEEQTLDFEELKDNRTLDVDVKPLEENKHLEEKQLFEIEPEEESPRRQLEGEQLFEIEPEEESPRRLLEEEQLFEIEPLTANKQSTDPELNVDEEIKDNRETTETTTQYNKLSIGQLKKIAHNVLKISNADINKLKKGELIKILEKKDKI